MVLEVHLDYLVREAEHDGMACAHPLLYVYDVLDATSSSLDLIRYLLVWVGLLSAFQIAPEVLEQSDFLLKILGVFSESVLLSNILSICTTALHVVEMEAIGVKTDLGGVVEEDTSGLVAQAVAETVL